MSLVTAGNDDLVDTIADLMLSGIDDDGDTLLAKPGLHNASQPVDPEPPSSTSETEKTLIAVIKIGLTFTPAPDGLSGLVLNGIFFAVGYSPPPEGEEEILQTVKNIEAQNTAIAKRLEYMSTEHRNDFRLNSMDDSYVELKTIHTRLHKKIDASEAITYILGVREEVEKCIEKAHNYLTNQTATVTQDGKRLLAIQAIQSHLWSKLESVHNFENYGILAYLSEARWFAKRMAKIQYLGTSILMMLVDLWNKGYKSPFDSPKKIANYRADLQETFMQRIRKYHQVLLGVGGDRIENWPSVQFILRQAQRKSADCFPELFRLQIGDNDIYYERESVKWKQGAFRNGDLRTAWVFHPDDNENYVLSTSGSRYNVYRKDVRKLRGEGITSAFYQPLYQSSRFEKVGRFKLIPQRGGSTTTFSMRVVDFANSGGEVTEFRISPTTQHEPAAKLLRPDAELAEVEQLYQHLRSFHGSVLDDGTDRHGFIIDVQNLSPSSKSVLVLNDLWASGFIEATAASHLIATNRADQRRMQVWHIAYTDVPLLELKFKSYWIEDGNTSDERLTAAF